MFQKTLHTWEYNHADEAAVVEREVLQAQSVVDARTFTSQSALVGAGPR
jgi:hypothetical protein